MDEQPQPNAVETTEALEAQPQDVEQPAEAVQTTDSEQTSTPDSQEPAPQADNSEEGLSDFWDKKGIDIRTPEGQAKAAKSYAEAEKRMHQSTQKSSELEKQLTASSPQVSDDPLVQGLADQVFNMQKQQEARDFVRENNVTDAQRNQFVEWLQANPMQQALVDNGYLTVNQAYTLSGIGNADTASIKQQGGREALEKLNANQRATAVPGNAVTSTPPAALTKANAESWWDSLGSEGRRDPENRAKLDRVLNS